MLNLMYITNNPEVAKIAQDAGVDRIMVDMEYIGKDIRQKKFGTPQNHHTFDDVDAVRKAVDHAEFVVRCNPIHEGVADYPDSRVETERILNLGADFIMLPYFKSADEVREHIEYVNGRAKIYLLVETSQAVDHLDEILEIPGIDEIHIGLNDLGICYNKKFLFESLTDGTVDQICAKVRKKQIPYGFGGIGAPGRVFCADKPKVSADNLIGEHYRLRSTRVILSRSFCNTSKISDPGQIRDVFVNGVRNIRTIERRCIDGKVDYEDNRALVQHMVADIVSGM